MKRIKRLNTQKLNGRPAHHHVTMLQRAAVVGLGVLCLGTASHPVQAEPRQVHLSIDSSKSTFAVYVYRSGLFKAFGHNHNIAVQVFSGDAQFTPGAIAPASLQMTVKTDSLAVTDNVSAGDKTKIEHTMKTDVLETATYPEITFKSTKITTQHLKGDQYNVTLTGNLTLHGVTRLIEFPGTATITENTLRAKGEFPLKQTDYSIKPVSVMGGVVKVKNEIKISFDIFAHAKSDTPPKTKD